jgi:predicted site-specific integrase-resolvase
MKEKEEDLIRVSEFSKQHSIDRKMLYYFISQGKLDITEKYGMKLIIINDRAKNFLENYKK